MNKARAARLGPQSAGRVRAWLLRNAPQHVLARLREVPLVLTHSVDRALAELAGTGDVVIVPGRGEVPAPPAGPSTERGAPTPLTTLQGALATLPLTEATVSSAFEGKSLLDHSSAPGFGFDAGGAEDEIDDIEPEAPALPLLHRGAPELLFDSTAVEDMEESGARLQESSELTRDRDDVDGTVERPVLPSGSDVALVSVPLLTVRGGVSLSSNDAPLPINPRPRPFAAHRAPALIRREHRRRPQSLAAVCRTSHLATLHGH